MNNALFLGLDFGSDSVRALLVTAGGEVLAENAQPYRRWSQGLYCDPLRSQYRQHPLDYLESLEASVRAVLRGQEASQVCGIGVDTTASTPCAVDGHGQPLALQQEFASEPDAMFMLWKDHTATAEAEEIAAAARLSPVDYTRYEGGNYSPEWFWSKYLHILRHNPRVRDACRGFVEHCDWITAELAASTVKPSRCAAGHKAMWHADWQGLPPDSFFSAIDPLLQGRRDALCQQTFTADIPVGHLSAAWAQRLGLSRQVVIAGGLIDCHAGAVGAGITPGVLVKVIGTSTCDILVAPPLNHCLRGICGQVDGSVVPGLTGLEAGQAAFGDIFAWFKRFLAYAGPVSLPQLESEAQALPPGQSVLALDWQNGRRSPDMNPRLQGALFGLTLATTPPMVYRALVEATAFGSRRIAERFREEGLPLNSLLATGGIARKSPLVMQTLADVLAMPAQVVDSEQTCALGAAMYASVASGIYPSLPHAMEAMKPRIRQVYRPLPQQVAAYDGLYQKYLGFAAATEKETARYA